MDGCYKENSFESLPTVCLNRCLCGETDFFFQFLGLRKSTNFYVPHTISSHRFKLLRHHHNLRTIFILSLAI